jgi:hypothetical protein
MPGLATRYLDLVISIKNPSMNEIEEVKGEDGWLTSEHKDHVGIAVPPTYPCGYPQWSWGGVTVGATDGRHPPALQPPVEVWRRDGWIPTSGGGVAAWCALRRGGVAGFMEREEEAMVSCLWGFFPFVWPTRTIRQVATARGFCPLWAGGIFQQKERAADLVGPTCRWENLQGSAGACTAQFLVLAWWVHKSVIVFVELGIRMNFWGNKWFWMEIMSETKLYNNRDLPLWFWSFSHMTLFGQFEFRILKCWYFEQNFGVLLVSIPCHVLEIDDKFNLIYKKHSNFYLKSTT